VHDSDKQIDFFNHRGRRGGFAAKIELICEEAASASSVVKKIIKRLLTFSPVNESFANI